MAAVRKLPRQAAAEARGAHSGHRLRQARTVAETIKLAEELHRKDSRCAATAAAAAAAWLRAAETRCGGRRFQELFDLPEVRPCPRDAALPCVHLRPPRTLPARRARPTETVSLRGTGAR